MRRALRIHPTGERGPVTRIEAEIRRARPATLSLTFELTGDVARLRLPPPAAPGFMDGLWRHSCFEAFVGLAEGNYLELNLAPSGRWAAYRFSGYREDMSPASDLAAPVIQLVRTGEGLALKARLDLSGVAGLDPEGAWRLGLAAVIEDAQGGLSYWALAHPAGKPDFHHWDGFVCEVRAPEDA